MNWSIPSLFERYLAFFDASPVWAVLAAIVVIFALLMLMRVAIKLFLLLLAIVALVLVASYFINGEDKTNDAIRQGAGQSSEMINQHLDKAEPKISSLKAYLSDSFGFEFESYMNVFSQFFQKENIGSTISFLRKFLMTLLMTAFFVVLWLAESINVQTMLNNTILKQKYTSVKAFIKIEKDLIKFIKVKVLVSALTGIFTGLMCLFFDVSFPIFWGLFAFVINFVQMVGSFASVILLSIFAFVELDTSNTLLFFMLSITLVQVVFGAVLEPIFMGKSFSINIIAVLVMLMFWGFLWGIPGLIMAIPITVFIKIIMEQFSGTKMIASLLSGKQTSLDDY